MAERNRALAVGLQADARRKAKAYYDEQHRQIFFNVGDLVLARMMGRRTKLQNRYAGTYEVMERQQDVYVIQARGGRGDRLERRISYLKPFVERVDNQVVATIIDQSQFHFQRVNSENYG